MLAVPRATAPGSIKGNEMTWILLLRILTPCSGVL